MVRTFATRFINTLFVVIAAVFAAGMAICLICATYVWAFTDDSPARFIGRAVVFLVFVLVFKFLSILDEYEFLPTRTTTTTTTRRPRKVRT